MLAKDIMNKKVATVLPDITIHEAVKMMVENELSGLMIVNSEQEVVGVISEKDVMVAFDWLGSTQGTIHDYYNKKIISVNEDTPIEEVSQTLVLNNIKRVPVLSGNKLVGIITRRDILRSILKRGM